MKKKEKYKCLVCRKKKLTSGFYKDKRAKCKSGLYSACKECCIKADRDKGWRKEYRKKWTLKNREKLRKYHENWRKNNLEKWAEYNKSRLEYFKKYQKDRRKIDKQFCLDKSMATTISYALRGKKAGRKWETLVGYTLEDLVKHLEKLFTPEMSWQNYGSYWEIDHKTPKSWFKYKYPEDPEFKKCWALKNLQPLKKSINRRKHNCYSN